MKTFRESQDSLEENASATVSAATLTALILKLRGIEAKVKVAKSVSEQNILIAEQTKLVGYISALQIAITSNDRKLIQKLSSTLRTKSS